MLQSRWAASEPASEPSQHPADPQPATDSQRVPAEPVPQVIEAPAQAAGDDNPYSPDPMVDEFAQTREDDDLFDDDFTPVAEPVVELTPVPEPAPEPAPQPASPPKGPARGREGFRGGRGRGGGRRGGGGGLAGSQYATDKAKEVKEVTTDAVEETNGQAQEQTGGEGQKKVPTGPKKEGAVRGDRSGTGGVKKAKLTEEQLAERMSAIALKNAKLTDAHLRAEADLAQYEAREAEAAAQAAARKKVERQNRQQMMGERERNRQRKLNALAGREWDMEKDEGFAGLEREHGGRARRGAHGGVTGRRESRTPEGREPDDSGSHGERRGGERGGRGRGRGGRGGRQQGRDRPSSQQRQRSQQRQQAPPTAADFPELPAAAPAAKEASSTATTTTTAATPTLEFPNKAKEADGEDGRPEPPQRMESFGFSSSEKKSWADQVGET